MICANRKLVSDLECECVQCWHDSMSMDWLCEYFIIRNLRKCRCPRSLMKKTYFALIRSILLYAYPCVCNSSSYLQNKFLRVEKRVSRIIGEDMSPALLDVAEESCSRLMSAITNHPQHPLRPMFVERSDVRTRSTQVLRRRRARTSRLSNSFVKFAERWFFIFL